MKFLQAYELLRSLAVRSQVLGGALVSGKMLAEPSLDEVALLRRYYPVPLQAAVVFAVFGDHVRAIIGHADQPCWIATFTVVGGVDDMAIGWHKSSIPRFQRDQGIIRQVADKKRI